MAEITGCARVTGTVIGEKPSSPTNPPSSERQEPKEPAMTARVGQKAPDFTAPSYYKGGFTPVKLSDFCRQMGAVVLLSRRFHLCLSDGSVGGRRQISGACRSWALK